jgi:hypothetical protein
MGGRRLGEGRQLASLPGGRPLAAAVFEADTVPIDEGIWTSNLVEECAVYRPDEIKRCRVVLWSRGSITIEIIFLDIRNKDNVYIAALL